MFSFFRRLHFEYTAKVSVQNGRYYENAVLPFVTLGADILKQFDADIKVVGGGIAQAMVRGYQGKDMSRNDEIMACVKHFALYGAGDAGACGPDEQRGLPRGGGFGLSDRRRRALS
jgi:hypothetical protein